MKLLKTSAILLGVLTTMTHSANAHVGASAKFYGCPHSIDPDECHVQNNWHGMYGYMNLTNCQTDNWAMNNTDNVITYDPSGNLKTPIWHNVLPTVTNNQQVFTCTYHLTKQNSDVDNNTIMRFTQDFTGKGGSCRSQTQSGQPGVYCPNVKG